MDANIIVIIILTILCCICIIVNILSYKHKDVFNYIFSLSVIILSSTVTGVSMVINETNGINPLDVYRNKTELQITYKIVNNDTISCDSIVVFKNK